METKNIKIHAGFRRVTAAVILLVLLVAVPGQTVEYPPAPFAPGEKLVFQLRWGFIPAGEATLEVLPNEVINGVEAYHFVMTARTNSVVDIFYRVRDRIDAYTDVGMNHSLLYLKDQQEGDVRRKIVVEFDWEKGEARYANFDREKMVIPLEPGSFDPLSIFYYTRMHDLGSTREIARPVTDGNKNVIGRATILGRETMRLAGRSFETIQMQPELKHVGGVFEKDAKAKLQLWVSADDWQIPVKVQSKVIVGSFVAELVACERGTGRH